MRHRHEAAAREQIAAHLPRIGLVQFGRQLTMGVADRNVAAEAGTGHAHPGATEIVVAAVGLALIVAVGAGPRLEQRGIAFGVGEVLLAHVDAMTDDGRHREQEGEPVPDLESVRQFGETSEQPLAKRSSHVPLLSTLRLHRYLVNALCALVR